MERKLLTSSLKAYYVLRKLSWDITLPFSILMERLPQYLTTKELSTGKSLCTTVKTPGRATVWLSRTNHIMGLLFTAKIHTGPLCLSSLQNNYAIPNTLDVCRVTWDQYEQLLVIRTRALYQSCFTKCILYGKATANLLSLSLLFPLAIFNLWVIVRDNLQYVHDGVCDVAPEFLQ